jgi:hypothetical protein
MELRLGKHRRRKRCTERILAAARFRSTHLNVEKLGNLSTEINDV